MRELYVHTVLYLQVGIKAAEYAKTGKCRNKIENVSRTLKGRLRKGDITEKSSFWGIRDTDGE
jgi:hypothetical protein